MAVKDSENSNYVLVKEKRYRSIIKTISWRLTGTMDTLFISYLITGSFTTAFSISAIEIFTKMLLYYLHERIWARLHIGRTFEQPPDYNI